ALRPDLARFVRFVCRRFYEPKPASETSDRRVGVGRIHIMRRIIDRNGDLLAGRINSAEQYHQVVVLFFAVVFEPKRVAAGERDRADRHIGGVKRKAVSVGKRRNRDRRRTERRFFLPIETKIDGDVFDVDRAASDPIYGRKFFYVVAGLKRELRHRARIARRGEGQDQNGQRGKIIAYF